MVASLADTILSCDWGTTNVRLRRVEIESGRVLEATSDERGAKVVYALWRESGRDRTEHYLQVIRSFLDDIGRRATDRAVVVSGMASSSIGLMELPYADVPFRLDGADLSYRVLEASSFDLPVLILSGVRTSDDVMRGEETELIGLRRALGPPSTPSIFILPGTHSKHVYVDDEAVTGFDTFMTGEVFDVMKRVSILHGSVESGPFDRAAFDRGVSAVPNRPLLSALFAVRTNALFGRIAPSANYWFLSGLLVGSELHDVAERSEDAVVLCGTSRLAPVYGAALETLGAGGRIVFVSAEQADRASVDGHLLAYQRLLESPSGTEFGPR